MSWEAPIATDSNGELILEFPDDMMEQLGWEVGDNLLWEQLDDGKWSLRKIETSNSQ